MEIVYLAAPSRTVTGHRRQGHRPHLSEDGAGRTGRLRAGRKPVPIEGAEFELPVDMVVPAIGQEADLGVHTAACGIKLTRWGTD